MEIETEPVLTEVTWMIKELVELQWLYPHHPCRHHFRYGRPKLLSLSLTYKGMPMSTTASPALVYLGSPSVPFTLSALDQYGFPYTGTDLANTSISSDNTANVTVNLGSFDPNTGEAVVTLTQAGGEGTANITITNGSISLVQPVESYVPALTSFTMVPQNTISSSPAAAEPASS